VVLEPATETRLRASPWELLRRTAGSPREVTAKAARLGRVLGGYARPDLLDERLEVQLAIGAWDMLRFWISPAADEYYRSKGIDYAFHQILRFLDEPASLADPIGFFSERDGIIGHPMQVVHASPVYDLELLQMFDDGLDELESQLERMVAGTHPRSRAIGAIAEGADYHARLLDFVQRFRADPTIARLVRTSLTP
jgi:hypothetical protein